MIRSVTGDNRDAAAWAARIAAVTRSGYAASDPLPGLPPPDGAREESTVVESELRRGARAWVLEADGRQAGVLRVVDHPDGTWEVRRVAVLPAWKRKGVASRLLAAVEAEADARAIPRVWLNAVVERCLPPIYARLGYRPVKLWPSEDKLTTEVTMARQRGARRQPLERPWEDVAALAGPGVLVSWLILAGEVLAVAAQPDGPVFRQAWECARATHDPAGVRLAGIDLWPGGGNDELACLLARLATTADSAGGAVVRFRGGRVQVPAHLRPRTVERRLLALWRFAPGLEPRLPDSFLAAPALGGKAA